MEEQITPLKTGIKYGGYLGMATIVMQLVVHYGGLTNLTGEMQASDFIVQGLTWIIGFALVYMGIKYFKDNNEGLLTFGEGISVSLFIGLFAGIISAIFMYIYAAYLMPDFGDAIMNNVDMDEMSTQEAEVMEQAMGFATSPIFLAFTGFIMKLLGCLIYGLIGSAILKKDQ